MMKTADKNNQILMETDQEKRGKMLTRICQGIRGKNNQKTFLVLSDFDSRRII